MKKIRIVVSAMVILVALTGCGNKTNDSQKDNTNTTTTESTTESTTDNQENANKDTKESNSTNSNNNTNTTTSKTDKSTNSKTDKSTNSNASSQSTAKESSKDQKSYYGSWKVTKLIPTYGGHATIDESTVIGTIMKFSSNEAIFGNDSFQNPKYETTSLSATDLREQFHREPSELGFSDDITITNVRVIVTGEEKPKLSDGFIVKDNDTLIYHVEGVFFEVKRVA